jgi:hypothetical protein
MAGANPWWRIRRLLRARAGSPPPVNEIVQLQDADFSLRDLLLMSEGRKEIPTAIELAILLHAKDSQA